MLVLARKKAEVIHIGTDVVIKVLHVRNGIVRIGIAAPDNVRVLRGELLDVPLSQDSHPDIAGAEFKTHAGSAGAAAPLAGDVAAGQPVAPLTHVLREFRDRPADDSVPALRVKPASRN